MKPSAAPDRNWGLPELTGPALALISAGVTAWQLALMQLLAWVQWYHFAYLVISLALLGFGASGTLLTLARDALLRHRRNAPGIAAAAMAATMAAAVPLLGTDALRFDLYLLFVDPWQILRLAGACLVLAVPFFLAGLVIGLSLMAGAAGAGRLYAWNLGGSGAGGVIGWMLLAAVAPTQLPPLVAALPLAGAMLIRPHFTGSRWRQSGPVLIAAAVIAIALAGPERLQPSQFKDISRLLDLPSASVVLSSPDPHGWLQVVDAPAFRPAPPGSLRFAGEYPRQRAVLLDGNLRGSILTDPTATDLEFLDFSLESPAWRMAKRSRALLMLGGGDGLAAWAIAQGASDVECVEPHPGIADAVEAVLPQGARVARIDPRTALARDGPPFDVIRFPVAGTFGGSAGLQAIGEQFLHTQEAFEAALRRLSHDGVIVASAWLDQPERSAPRLLSTILAGLNVAGISEPRAHIAAIRSWSAVAFFVKRSPLTPEDIASVVRACDEMEFDPLLLPGLETVARENFHSMPGGTLFARIDESLAADDGGTLRVGPGPFRLDAATDAKPYFSQFLRISQLPRIAGETSWRGAPFVELGYVIVALSVPLLSMLALTLIVVPLVGKGWGGGSCWRTGLFCAGLGFGFMSVEIGLIARLNLFLGGALPAAATVLTALLVCAGAGSQFSQRFEPTRGRLRLIAVAVSGAVLLLWWVTGVLPIGSGLPLWARSALAAAAIAPVAFAMGMAFPTLLRVLESEFPSHVPWAWAVNGCASVVAPSLATMIAVLTGFPGVFVGAAAFYALAAFAMSVRSIATTQA